MWPSGKVLASGARDRQFESGHPDFSFSPELLYEDCNNEGVFYFIGKTQLYYV